MNIYNLIEQAETLLEDARLCEIDSGVMALLTDFLFNIKALEPLHSQLNLEIFIPNTHNVLNNEVLQTYYHHLKTAQNLLENVQSMTSEGSSDWVFKAVINLFISLVTISSKETYLSPVEELAGFGEVLLVMEQELVTIKEQWTNHLAKRQALFDKYAANIKFLTSQGLIPGFGKSDGECYGITLTYVKHRISGEPIDHLFSAHANYMQKEQNNHDRDFLNETRLDTIQYQPNLREQAQSLLQYANNNPNEHLAVTLYESSFMHVTYIQFEAVSNTWHYFDCSHGGFEFTNADDFIQFYQELYEHQLQWHSFEVMKLHESKKQNTWSGKLRSILTGARYTDGIVTELSIGKTLIGTTFLALCVAAMFVLSSLLAVGMPLVLSFAGVAAIGLFSYHQCGKWYLHTQESGFKGLLGVPRYIRHLFHSKPQITPLPTYEVLPTSSTAFILEQLPEKDFFVFQPPISEQSKADENTGSNTETASYVGWDISPYRP